MKGAIHKVSINGFKSIRELKSLTFHDLNVIIGANGSGKSNLIEVFRLLMAMVRKNLQEFVLKNGEADNFLHNGIKNTPMIEIEIEFNSGSSYSIGSNFYHCELIPAVDGTFLISEKRKYFDGHWRSYGSPSKESGLYDFRNEKNINAVFSIGHYIYDSIVKWVVYHFHDTSSTAPMRRSEIIEDNEFLRHNGSNIAPFLRYLKENKLSYYQNIVNAIRLVMPFFDDFKLDVKQFGEAEKVKLDWRQKGSDFPMQPYHFSDGSMRFICLATALLQPSPPSTIVIDEPELGLHPEAIRILGELITDAAKQTQIIIATQSPLLVDQFEIKDIVVANRFAGQSTFERLGAEDFNVWLEDYSVGELWVKNVIEAGTCHE